MFRQLQRSVRRKKLVRAAVFFALALLLLALFAPGLAAMVRGPADLYAADIDGLEGRYVAARVDIIYDWYAETVRRDSTGAEQTVRRNYIIPVGSSQFMGLDVDTARLGEAQAVLASTAAVMEGRAESLDGSAVVVRGTIRRMDAQEQEFYRSVANYGSLTADDQARFLPLVLVCGQVGNYTEQALQLGVLAAALLALAGLAAAGAGRDQPRPGPAGRLPGGGRRRAGPAALAGAGRVLPPDPAAGAAAGQLPLGAVRKRRRQLAAVCPRRSLGLPGAGPPARRGAVRPLPAGQAAAVFYPRRLPRRGRPYPGPAVPAAAQRGVRLPARLGAALPHPPRPLQRRHPRRAAGRAGGRRSPGRRDCRLRSGARCVPGTARQPAAGPA